MKHLIYLILPVALLCACGSESPDDVSTKRGKPVVYTTFYPTTYFAERIGGDLIEVVCPVPEDEDAIFWQPDGETIARYQAADLIVVNGAEFEKWVLTTSLPTSRVVDTAKPLRDDLVHFEKTTTHRHGPAGEHEHKGIDGHTWLDPQNAAIQAEQVLEGLKRILPDHEADLDGRFAALARDLGEIDAALTKMAEGYDGHPILASHPAYNYLAKRYGLNMVNLDLDPEETPGEETFASLAKLLEEKPARHILWESAPAPSIAARFAKELGVTSVEFSPCELMEKADLAAGEDYLTVMRRNVEALAPVLSE